MINLLLGSPGAGKSYEAVVFHVMPALRSGRKVITNLPLNILEIQKQIPKADELIDIRNDKAGEPAFSLVEHYHTDWRNDKNQGPFFVIDECHKPLKRRSLKNVESTERLGEWYAEHRHSGADVLLITQSYGKINRDIVDLVQMVWRCRKNVALGSKKTYVRKTLDGVRGAEVATVIRKYKSENFSLYQSHTASSGSVDESGASEVRPLWRHWTFLSSAVFFLIAVYMGFSGFLNPFPDSSDKDESIVASSSVSNVLPDSSVVNSSFDIPADDKLSSTTSNSDDISVIDSSDLSHPFSGLKLHSSGFLSSDGKKIARFVVSQNGQRVFNISDTDLVKSGYELEFLAACVWRIKYGSWSNFILCDSPSVGVAISGKNYNGSSGVGEVSG